MDEYRTDPRVLEAKEPETLDWIDRYVKPGDVLFDIGANVGVYSIYAALRGRRACRVFAFEPEFRNFASLNANILLNGLSDLITAYCLALADEPRLAVLQSGQDESGHSGNYLDRCAPAGAAAVRVQGAVSASLDDLVYRYGLPCPNHLKIDTDGAELAIVNGADRLLSDPRVTSIMCEIEPDTREGTAAMAAVQRRGFVGLPGPSVNILFARSASA